MQILKVYDNGPPAMEVGTTHKYELKDKDRFRLTAIFGKGKTKGL